MSKKYKPEPRKGTVSQAIDDGLSGLQDLKGEVEELVNNASGTALENTSRIQTFQSTLDVLENIPDSVGSLNNSIPDGSGELECDWQEMVIRRKSQRATSVSRAVRRDNACAMLSAAADALAGSEAEDDQALAEELQELVSEAEGCEFPGMFG